MARLSDEQLMQVLYQAGFRGDALVTAFAVAKAESGGNAQAYNGNAGTGDKSYGLFQINMLGSMGPERRKQFGLKSNDDLYDPAVNARIAFQMSNGGKTWTPWSVHPDSKSRGGKGSGFERHLATGQQTLQQMQASGSLTDAGTVSDVQAASTDGVAPAEEPTSVNAAGLSVPQVPDEIANLPDEELRDYLEGNYGYLAWALRIPEVGDILLEVARGNLTDPDKLFGQLYATDWWQNTQASVRQWDALAGQDPTEAKEQVRATRDALALYATRLGLQVDQERLWAMARDALRFGWIVAGQDPAGSLQVRNALFAEANRATVRPEQAAFGDAAALEQGYDATYARVKKAFENRGVEIGTADETEEERLDRITRSLLDKSRTWESLRASLDMQRPLQPGILTATADTLKALAAQYLVPLSDHAARVWSEKIAKGESTQEAFQSYLQQQASSMFSGNKSVQSALEQGLTVRQWADPYVETAARLLEMNPADIDLTEDRWMRALHQVDPNAGGGTPMGLGEFQRYVRGLPEWDKTQNAIERASAATEFLGQRMGAI